MDPLEGSRGPSRILTEEASGVKRAGPVESLVGIYVAHKRSSAWAGPYKDKGMPTCCR